MIQYIDFDHYRVFSERQRLRLAPLTVVFGKNNTGKSAVLKLPMLIHNALCCQTYDVFSKIDSSGCVICDEYRDVIYGKGNHATCIEVKSESGTIMLKIKFVAENTAEGSHSRIEEYYVSDEQKQKSIRAQLNDNNVLTNSETGEEVVLHGVIPSEVVSRAWISESLRSIDDTIDYIGPVRWIPKRYFNLDDLSDGVSRTDGKKAYVHLVKDSQNILHPLLDKVSNWYRNNFGGWKIVVNNHRNPVYSIELSNDNLPNNNILDTGFGIQQSLPIVVAAFRKYNEPTLVIIEEPETHLNPSAHAQIGELLATAALDDRSKKFLVETHSLNLMIRLRTLIAKGVLKKEDVALYHVDYNEATCSSALKEVIIDEKGDVQGWPEDMFNETLNEALALREAQMNR